MLKERILQMLLSAKASAKDYKKLKNVVEIAADSLTCHFVFQCDEQGICKCDADGSCMCKSNVEGKKCSACRIGTFGLAASDPDGCTDCFCFGRSSTCTQANYVWTQVGCCGCCLSGHGFYSQPLQMPFSPKEVVLNSSTLNPSKHRSLFA